MTLIQSLNVTHLEAKVEQMYAKKVFKNIFQHYRGLYISQSICTAEERISWAWK